MNDHYDPDELSSFDPRNPTESPRGLRKCVSYLQMRAPRGAKALPLDRNIRCACGLRGIFNPPSPSS